MGWLASLLSKIQNMFPFAHKILIADQKAADDAVCLQFVFCFNVDFSFIVVGVIVCTLHAFDSVPDRSSKKGFSCTETQSVVVVCDGRWPGRTLMTILRFWKFCRLTRELGRGRGQFKIGIQRDGCRDGMHHLHLQSRRKKGKFSWITFNFGCSVTSNGRYLQSNKLVTVRREKEKTTWCSTVYTSLSGVVVEIDIEKPLGRKMLPIYLLQLHCISVRMLAWSRRRRS